MRRKSRFTIYHGLAVSLALHSVLALPFVLEDLLTSPAESSPLVLDLQGAIADVQTEKQVAQEPSAEAAQTAQAAPVPEQAQKPEAAPPEPEPPPPQPDPEPEPVPQPETKPAPPQPQPAAAAPSVEQKPQEAQTLRNKLEEEERIREYARALSRKVRANLVQPDTGRNASAVVSFVVLANGQLRPDSVKIITSSGQAKLDASAVKTVRASAPFSAPPKELSVAITVDFGPQKAAP
jgi:protein TonB